MNCPSCGARVGFKACLSSSTQGFICSSCKARLIANQFSPMIRYLVYLVILLLLGYYFGQTFIVFLLFFLVATCFDLMVFVRPKVVDETDNNEDK